MSLVGSRTVGLYVSSCDMVTTELGGERQGHSGAPGRTFDRESARYPQITMIGAAWRGLATELEETLRAEDPSARVTPWVDAGGSLRFKVAVGPGQRSAARQTVRRFEARAATVCETCGGEVRQTRSAPGMAVYLCPDCVGH